MSKKCDFVKGQLKANIVKPSKLWKVLKSLGLSSKDSNNSKVCLKENGIAYFEPKETSGIWNSGSYLLLLRYIQWIQLSIIMNSLIFKTI